MALHHVCIVDCMYEYIVAVMLLRLYHIQCVLCIVVVVVDGGGGVAVDVCGAVKDIGKHIKCQHISYSVA